MAMGKAPRDDDVKRQVGLRLRCVREVLGLDQATFGRAIGAEANRLGNWERGERLADVLSMTRIFERFGFTLEWIYAGRLHWMDFATQEALTERAAALGAVVGGTVAEWPAAVERRAGLAGAAKPARVPKAKRDTPRTVHEEQQKAEFE